MTAYAVPPLGIVAHAQRGDEQVRAGDAPARRARAPAQDDDANARREGRRARIATQSPVASTPAISDAVLVARVLAADDRHAFAELTRRHQSSVRALLRRLVRGDHALADDLAQDAFIQVYRNLRQYRGDARFSTWIYRIAYNCFLAHVRAAHPHEALPEQLPEAAAERSLAHDTAMKLDLERALESLSDGERAAIVHCYWHDLSHEEAAYVLGCPLGTVKTHVLRAKQKLRRLLASWAPAERAPASDESNEGVADADR